ncbi:MAG: hypothetical protein ACPIOQ_80845, partial [Promethearchaeia archaeon]
TRGGSSDPVGHALMCHETMEGMQGCELGGLADLTDWGNSQVLFCGAFSSTIFAHIAPFPDTPSPRAKSK